MSGAAGTWDVTTTSVIGDMTFEMTLSEAGNGWSGIVEGADGLAEVRDLVVHGDRVSLTLRVAKPAPADFDVFATVSGDTMTGTAKTKFLPEARLAARRRVAGARATGAEPIAAAESPVSAPLVPVVPPPAAGKPDVAPGLIGYGGPVVPDTVALEFELPPPPPPGLVPPQGLVPPGRPTEPPR